MNGRRIDLPALIFGIIFLAIAGSWMIDRGIGLDLPSAGWIIAGMLIALGAVGIMNAIRSNTGSRQ